MIPASNSAEHWLVSYVNACGSKRGAAHRLGIPRGTLRRWLKEIDANGVVHSSPKRVQALKQRLDGIAPRGTATADALMGIWGFKRVARGDDMTCASFPGEDFVVSKDIEDGKRGFGPDMAKRIRNSQTANGETKERVNAKSVHKSRIADGKARKRDGWKDILLVSDMHCGHSVGLTPPGRWQGEDYEIQREVWEFYEREVNAHGPYDACFDLGDNIDGRGSRSGGTELITNDLLDQTDIATQCLLAIPTDKFYMVYGTPYHVSVEGTDMERQISDNLKLHGKEVTISGHEWIDVNGCVFDIKHKVGSSGTPYGRHTAISKARIWNDMWALRNMAPRADVFCRGHVHYHVDCGGVRNGRPWRAMTLPALQGPGSKFGIRQCEGEVNFGFVVFHVSPEGKFTWDVHEFQPKAGQPIARVM